MKMRWKTIVSGLLSCLAIGSGVQASAPLTHIYLAEVWCAVQDVAPEDRDLVAKGSIFPDVCQVSNVSKEQTHGTGLFGDIFLANGPFEQGQRLHHFVDTRRKELIAQSGIYALIEPYAFGRPSKLLQMMEDELAYEWFQNESRSQNFAIVTETEVATGIDRDSLDRWNAHLRHYLSTRPTVFLQHVAEADSEFWSIPADVCLEWSVSIPVLIEMPEFQEYMQFMLLTFAEDFKKSPDALTTPHSPIS